MPFLSEDTEVFISSPGSVSLILLGMQMMSLQAVMKRKNDC